MLNRIRAAKGLIRAAKGPATGHLGTFDPGHGARSSPTMVVVANVQLASDEMAPDDGTTARLSSERCRSLLGGAVNGHLALSQGALPLVVPVTCALAHDYLLVRAGLDWFVRAPFQPGVVAFETSSTSFNQDWRWEVVAQGRAEVSRGAPTSYGPPPLPLVGNELTAVLRISLEILTGWQYGVPPRPQRS